LGQTRDGVPFVTPPVWHAGHTRLTQIDRAEQAVRRLGIRQVRVRHHGSLARLEVELDDLPTLLTHRASIVRTLYELGYTYVTIDLDGYRMGNLNEVRR
jgi:uncharacterized protein